MNRRILIQLEDDADRRIRLLSFQTQTPIVEIIRQCVDRSLEAVEAHLAAKPNLRPATIEDVKRLDELIERSAYSRAAQKTAQIKIAKEPSL